MRGVDIPRHSTYLLALGTPAATSIMQVAIVGGGICGLTCAIALMKAGVDVQVYEAAVDILPFILLYHTI